MKSNHDHNSFNLSKKLDNNLETLIERNNFLLQQVPNHPFVKSHWQYTNSLIIEIYDFIKFSKLSPAIEIVNKANGLFLQDSELSIVLVKIVNTNRTYREDAVSYLNIETNETRY